MQHFYALSWLKFSQLLCQILSKFKLAYFNSLQCKLYEVTSLNIWFTVPKICCHKTQRLVINERKNVRSWMYLLWRISSWKTWHDPSCPQSTHAKEQKCFIIDFFQTFFYLNFPFPLIVQFWKLCGFALGKKSLKISFFGS